MNTRNPKKDSVPAAQKHAITVERAAPSKTVAPIRMRMSIARLTISSSARERRDAPRMKPHIDDAAIAA
jgi:hypothetical protein